MKRKISVSWKTIRSILKRKYPLLLGAVSRLSGELKLYAINAKVISILSLIPVPSSLAIQLPSK